MPDPAPDYEVNIVLSGQHQTSVKALSAGQKIDVILSGQEAVAISQLPGAEAVIALPGVQGPAGTNTAAKGPDGAIQFNDAGLVTGKNTFLFDKGDNKVFISGGSLVLQDSDLIISGNPLNPRSFSVRDGSKNLLTIDSQNKKIVLSENTGPSEYYIGIGTNQPQEKFHLQGGNMRVDGDVIVSGHITPKESGVFDLGAVSKPWRDIYLEGESLIFTKEKAKISIEDGAFIFSQKDPENEEVYKDIFKAKKVGDTTFISGVTLVDTVITGAKSEIAAQVEGGEGLEVSYSSLQDAGLFITKNIPVGATHVFMSYGQNLGYTPKVVCTLIVPDNSTDMYYFVLENITSQGADAFFSDGIAEEGYKLDCFVSPKVSA